MGGGERNVAKLTADAAPWDDGKASLRQTLNYVRKHGIYVVPESIDLWEFRDLLHRLDPVCLRGLQSQGAMSPTELAGWINHNGVLRTEPSKTGIVEIARETAAAWAELAWRRGVVAPWAGATETSSPADDTRWVSAEKGGAAFGSRLVGAILRIPAGLVGFLLSGGGLAAAYAWLQANPTALTILIAVGGFVAYLGAIALVAAWVKRTRGPSSAVVVIETLRSSGQALPSLDAGAQLSGR